MNYLQTPEQSKLRRLAGECGGIISRSTRIEAVAPVYFRAEHLFGMAELNGVRH
jgi:hypothetical protein